MDAKILEDYQSQLEKYIAWQIKGLMAERLPRVVCQTYEAELGTGDGIYLEHNRCRYYLPVIELFTPTISRDPLEIVTMADSLITQRNNILNSLGFGEVHYIDYGVTVLSEGSSILANLTMGAMRLNTSDRCLMTIAEPQVEVPTQEQKVVSGMVGMAVVPTPSKPEVFLR